MEGFRCITRALNSYNLFQVRTVLKARSVSLRIIKKVLLKGAYNVPGRKTCRKFGLNDFGSFWSWANLQLFIWGGDEFVSQYIVKVRIVHMSENWGLYVVRTFLHK